MSRYVSLAAAAAVAAVLSFGATTAEAVTITVQSGGVDTAISINCDADCNGVVSDFAPAVTSGDGQLHNSIADLFDLGSGSSESHEVGAINTLFGTSYTVADTHKTGFEPSVNSYSFDSSAEFIAFKIGGGTLDGKHFFIKLLLPVPVTVAFLNNGQTSGGLSHLTQIGNTVVPLPAGLVLFLTGLAGIGALGRIKSKHREVPTA